MPVMMFGSWVIKEIWISLGRFFFFNGFIHIIGIVLCYSHKACSLLYHLYESLVTIAVTFTFSRCNCGFGFEQKYWRIQGFGEKRHGSVDLHTPITPLFYSRIFTEL